MGNLKAPRPTILVNGRGLDEVTADALDALMEANDPPRIFRRGGHLARVRADEHGHYMIDRLSESITRCRLVEVARFVREVQSHGAIVQIPANVPRDLVGNLLALEAWDFPILTGVTEIPVLR